MIRSAAFIVLALSLPSAAQAQIPMPGMPMHGMPMPAGNASSEAFKASNDRMMKGMDVPLTGDTDRDFVASMIPHHQGAIDMAKIELHYGKDPAIRALAAAIIAAQEKEIADMTAWRNAHP